MAFSTHRWHILRMLSQRGELGPEYRVEYPINVVLTGCAFRCTRCTQWKPGAEFGLRCVTDADGNETIRNQPQCQACRKKPRSKLRLVR